MKRAVISGSATGGHFYPALVLADKLSKQGWEIVFVVKECDFAIKFLKEKGIPFVETRIKSFPRSFDLIRHVAFWFHLNRSLEVTSNIIKDFTPDIVITTGGYVSFPLVLNARIRKVPVLLHEQNAKMGLANRFSSYLASKITLGLPLQKPKGNKFILTATPVREEFSEKSTREEALKKLGLSADKKVIAVFGGSGGARKLNEAVVDTVKTFCHCRESGNLYPRFHTNDINFYFIHITGKRDYEYIKNLYGAIPENVRLVDYQNQMNEVLRSADLVISRAGAGTVAELMVTRTPALLVPFPRATGNHQYYNAKVLADKGAAIIIKEDDNLSQNITEAVNKLFTDAERINQMQSAYNKLSLPNPINAADKLAEIAQILAK